MKTSKFLKNWNIFFLILTSLVYSQNSTEIVHIPDVNFEQALIDLGIDSDLIINATVLKSDVENIEVLDISRRGISSLEGIQAFSNLKYLRAWENQLTSLDVSSNPLLVQLSIANNQITSLDLSNNTAIVELYAYNNDLTSLQIPSNDQLVHLSISDNQLTVLDLINSSALVDIYINNNNLSEVYLGYHPNLVNFHARGNSISDLDVSGSPLLRSFLVWGSNLSAINLSGNLQLEELDLNNNNLNSLDLSNNPKLRFAFCGSNNLTSLNIANGNNAGLISPEWSDYSFVASGNPNLACIQVDAGMVETNRADWGKDGGAIYSANCFTKPEYVSIPDSNFEQALIDLNIDTGIVNGWLLESVALNIQVLDIPSRGISSLDGLQAFSNLRELHAYDNQISSLDFSGNSELVNISLSNNQLTSLDVSHITNLEQIHVNRNIIDNLIFDGHPNLWGIYAGGNQLSSIDVTGMPSLQILVLWENNLQQLELQNNLALKELFSDHNQLTSLDVSSNSNLETLFVLGNELTSLNIANGNNANFVSPDWSDYSFVANANPDLKCIQVDPEMDATNRADWGVDYGTIFTDDCTNLPTVYIPDPNFEQALIDLGIDGDGIIDASILEVEARFVTWLDLSKSEEGYGIQDLTGIEAFMNLTGINCNFNQISNLDFSSNLLLRDIYANTCEIQTLNVSSNTELVNLHVYQNQISEIDLSNNSKLKELIVQSNNLSTLDLSGNTNLTMAFCGWNQLTSLNIANGNNANFAPPSWTNVSFGADGNPDLRCIQVDGNIIDVIPEHWQKDFSAVYNEDCESYVSSDSWGIVGSATPGGWVGPDIPMLYDEKTNTWSVTTELATGEIKFRLNNYWSSNYGDGEWENTIRDGILDWDGANIPVSGGEYKITLNFTTLEYDIIQLNLNPESIAGKWIIAPEVGSLKVGPEPGSGQWWQNDEATLTDRSCYFDNVYEFGEDGSFLNVFGDETILEPFQGVETQTCGAPFAPHDGSIPATYIYDHTNGTITLNGRGSFIGISSAVNGGVLPDISVPESINYEVSFTENGNVMHVSLDIGNGYWTYKLIKDAVFIPDNNFEQSLIDVGIDSDGIINNRILRGDAKAVQGLNLNNPVFASENEQRYANPSIVNVEGKIQDLMGIEAFVNLTFLRAWSHEINQVNLRDLTELNRLEFINNQIASIDVSNNTKLKILWLEKNNLNEADISNNPELINIAFGYNNLTELDVSQNLSLDVITVEANNLGGINVTNNLLLNQIWIADNPAISQVDFSKNSELFGLGIYNTAIKSLDLSNNPMTRLFFGNNPNLEHLDIRNGNNINLTQFEGVNTPLLSCINVDPEISEAMRASGKSFSEDCGDFVYIPDANFEQALIDLGIDSDGVINTSILKEDAEQVNWLPINNPLDNDNLPNVTGKIQDLTGIEAFSNLTGIECSSNSLTSLDFSSNLNLVDVYASFNSIESVNFEVNTKLKQLFISDNNLEVLDLSTNHLLERLICFSNKIIELDLTENPNLKVIHCGYNMLNSLNLANGNNQSFEAPSWTIYSFDTEGNPNLGCIQIDEGMVENIPSSWNKDDFAIYSSDCVTKPEYVNIPDSNFEQSLIDLGIDSDGAVNTWLLRSDAEVVTGLNLNNPEFDPSEFANPEIINVFGKIADLTGIEAFVNITKLQASYSEFTQIDLSDNKLLVELQFINNSLRSLDVSQLSNLKFLSVIRPNSSSLPDWSTIDLTGNSLLEELYIINMGISEINLSSNSRLIKLFLQYNNLANLDIITNTALTEVRCQWNQLAQLDITSLANLERLDAYHNSNLDLVTGANGNLLLSYLNLNATGLTNFNGGLFPSLKTLWLNDNGLSNFNGNNNLSLVDLRLNNNTITKLNLPGNSLLEELQVRNNAMEELDLRNANNLNLERVSATGNLLTCVSVDDPADTAMPYKSWELDLGVQLSLNCKQAEEVVIIPDANFEQALIDLGFDTNGFTGNILLSEAEVITVLDVSSEGISNAIGIEGFVNLIELNISNNNLAEVNLFENLDLVILDLSGNSLTELFVSNGRIMTDLNASGNELTQINFGDLTNLQNLDISGNNFEALDFSDFGNLEMLNISNNALHKLDLRNGNNQLLNNMNASGNLLTCIGVDNTSNIPGTWIKDTDTEYTATGDCEAPIVQTRDIIISLDRYGFAEIAAVDIDGGSFDNTTESKNLLYSIDVKIFSCDDLGSDPVEVELSVTDEAGNIGYDTASITVVDEIAPEASSVRSVTLDLNGATSVNLLPADINDGSTDNCPEGLEFSINQDSFSFPGQYDVILTATDASGNLSESMTKVEVMDSQSEPTTLKFKQNLVATVYPVPFSDYIRIGFSKPVTQSSVGVSLITLSGGGTGVSFNWEGNELVSNYAGALESGIYDLVLTINGQTQSALINRSAE